MAKVVGGLLCLVLERLAPSWTVLALTATAAVLVADRALEHVGGDGADQQLRIVGVALALTALAKPFDPGAADAGVFFLAAQLAFAYGVAGLSKAASPAWRSGEAIRSVAAAPAYGAGRFSPLFARWPRAAVGIGWGVIVFEATFPLYLLSGRAALAGLALAFGFHLAIAIGMRLNSFLWVFPISYPAFYAFAERVQLFLAGR